MHRGGRMRRRTILLAYLIINAAIALAAWLDVRRSSDSVEAPIYLSWYTENGLLTIVSLAAFTPWLIFCARRFHDANYSGWWLLIYVGWRAGAVIVAMLYSDIVAIGMTIVGEFGLLGVLTMPGTVGPNRYGLDPRGRLTPGTAEAFS